MTKHSLTNNDTLTTGINKKANGAYLALTHSASKTYKTYKGAEKWLAKRGYNADGTKK